MNKNDAEILLIAFENFIELVVRDAIYYARDYSPSTYHRNKLREELAEKIAQATSGEKVGW